MRAEKLGVFLLESLDRGLIDLKKFPDINLLILFISHCNYANN